MTEVVPELVVQPHPDDDLGIVYRGWCSAHGMLPIMWVSDLTAAWDLAGHAAHHHGGRRGAADS